MRDVGEDEVGSRGILPIHGKRALQPLSALLSAAHCPKNTVLKYSTAVGFGT
jgi:hypothetical protein